MSSENDSYDKPLRKVTPGLGQTDPEQQNNARPTRRRGELDRMHRPTNRTGELDQASRSTRPFGKLDQMSSPTRPFGELNQLACLRPSS
ncbi:hypothetical protein F2Q70_00017382 [Brassica cretica]|uniref:Uncharacterized protein n=1 Tax=Brassica cretica TaxID=69181 RepID=A0A8S9L1M2_BRACR|nr:hypothetical protein F2Q70_00017382 [Brassica cretica]KAF2599483.1 hypothetical protein F2Q68_00010349 [Brassica cretica]